ncbi:stage II sporulation protein P [Virgibacillus flavescens]|uniref:stage II sporulation protein P n=1 Tax=Virgibacillus flavescens TaxID=1611422 RepID=UPI003D338811
MNLKNKSNPMSKRLLLPFYKKGGLYILSVVLLFVSIGVLTTIAPAYRFSSETLSEWTSKVESTTFLYLLGMENRAFQDAFPNGNSLPKLSTTLFQLTTSVKPYDVRSLLGRELPGFSIFDSQIIIAGNGTNYTNLPVESSPPLNEILKDREAEVNDPTETEKETTEENTEVPEKLEENVVFIYNTHNTESFLPHLPEEENPDLAHHGTVNISKVSDRLAETLENNGVGAIVDHTNIANILNQKGMEYYQSYKASRDVVKEAFAQHKEIKYAFDIHRDSIAREKTTTTINGKSYAQIMMVIGAEYASYEKNLALATKLHYLIEEKYPGLSRGVIKKKGAATNGVFNQDLSENALLFEIGGVGNNLDELYRSADALAEVFSDYYFDAEKVSKDAEEE